MAKTTKNKKTSIKKPTYMKGIIGSFIGGMIASIPWIWIYVYGQEIYTIFALIIATGAIIGYFGYTIIQQIKHKLPNALQNNIFYNILAILVILIIIILFGSIWGIIL